MTLLRHLQSNPVRFGTRPVPSSGQASPNPRSSLLHQAHRLCCSRETPRAWTLRHLPSHARVTRSPGRCPSSITSSSNARVSSWIRAGCSRLHTAGERSKGRPRDSHGGISTEGWGGWDSGTRPAQVRLGAAAILQKRQDSSCTTRGCCGPIAPVCRNQGLFSQHLKQKITTTTKIVLLCVCHVERKDQVSWRKERWAYPKL